MVGYCLQNSADLIVTLQLDLVVGMKLGSQDWCHSDHVPDVAPYLEWGHF